MNRSFYLHSFDTWQVSQAERINQYDMGRRCRGNIQLHMMPSGTGCLCFVSFNDSWRIGSNREIKFYSDLPVREVYRVAWRTKRLLDRYGTDGSRPAAAHNEAPTNAR